jgi:hypothetical protein
MRKKWIFMAPLILVMFIIFIFIGGQVVKELWNWLLPSIFGWREITFWQALGMLVLCRILFGGFGCSGRNSSFRNRMNKMTPEEREKFRKRFWGRCAPPESAPDPSKPTP